MIFVTRSDKANFACEGYRPSHQRCFNPCLIFILFFYCFFQFGCAGFKLIDVPKSTAALELTQQQQRTIQPKLQLISDMVTDYNFEKKRLEVDYQVFRAGMTHRQFDRYQNRFPDMRSRRELNAFRDEARKFLRQRDIFLREIQKLVAEIAAALTAAQRVKLAKLKMPALEIPMMLRNEPYSELRYIPNHPLGGVNLF